jgi:hypothetical protein
MIEVLSFYFPTGIFMHPAGGFFLWLEATENLNYEAKWFNEYVSIPNDILYVPPEAFYLLVGYMVKVKGHLVPTYPKKMGCGCPYLFYRKI